MKRLALITMVVVAVVVGALALWQMREAVILLVIALTVASSISPMIRWLMRRRLSRNRAVAVAFLSNLVVLVGIVVLFGSLAYAETALLVERLPAWYEGQRQALLAREGWVSRISEILPTTRALTGLLARGEESGAGAFVLGLTANVVTGGALIISVAALGFYWLLDQQRIERLWLSLMPLDARTSARAIWCQIYDEVGIYLRGEIIIVFLASVSLLSVYSILNVPGGALLALIGGVAQIVPLLGFPIAVLSGATVAFYQGPWVGVWTLAGVIYVLSVIKYVIGRRIFRSGINVNPVLVIFLIMALAELGGVLLILLAPPLAAAIQVTMRILTTEQRIAVQPTQELQIRELEARLAAIELGIPSDKGHRRLRDILSRTQKLVADAAAHIPDPPRAAESSLPPDRPRERAVGKS